MAKRTYVAAGIGLAVVATVIAGCGGGGGGVDFREVLLGDWALVNLTKRGLPWPYNETTVRFCSAIACSINCSASNQHC